MPESLPVPRTIEVDAIGHPAAHHAGPPVPGAGSQAYFHALRRRWWLVAMLGLLCGGGGAAATWHFQKASYTARALLRVAAAEQQLVFDTADRTTLDTFTIYKNTQQQLVKSDFVLMAALRDPEVAAMPVVRGRTDPVKWLADELEVDYPGDAELMQIELSSDDPKAAARLVSAVVDAYMREVVNVERDKRNTRLDELDRVYADKEAEMRNKRTDLKHLAEQLGTGDTEALAVKQQITLQQFAELRKETTRLQYELRRLQTQLSVKQAALQSPDRIEAAPAEIDALAEKDRTTLLLLSMRDALLFTVSDVDRRIVPQLAAQHTRGYQAQLAALDEQLKDRREQLRRQVQHAKQTELESEVAELKIEMEIASQQHATIQQDLDAVRKQVEEIGGSSIDVEMMRAEIDHLENVLTPIAEERERVKVELRSAPRISIIQQAQVPRVPDQMIRAQLTAFAGIFGFGLPAFGILLLDVRARRISRSDEISDVLGLSVLGTVPLIPHRAIRHSHTARQQHWRALLDEAVDGVVVRILREAERQPMQVLLISSASSGEGKTTLATQLALSLARLGRRVLLVDCDLRKPAVNKVFSLPLGPGVADLLVGSSQLSDLVHPTSTENLWVVTAGRWSQQGLQALAGAPIEAMLSQMRSQYDFVVVDGSPILPVADSRAIARHVDGVILSVLRDVSQIARVQATWRILAALGVWNVGSVVTGSAHEIYYRDSGYSSYISA